MSSCTTVLTVLPVALSRVEHRIFEAALKLSREQRRTLSYRTYEEGSSLAPDLVVVSSDGDEPVDRRLAKYFGSEEHAALPLVELNGNLAMAANADIRQSSTPFGILECLDCTARREYAVTLDSVSQPSFTVNLLAQQLRWSVAPLVSDPV